MTQTEKLYSNIADRNEAMFNLRDQGLSHAEIAARLKISEQIVRNFLGDDTMGGN